MRHHALCKENFWCTARKGLYMHSAGNPVLRCYGCVGHLADQMVSLMEHYSENLDH